MTTRTLGGEHRAAGRARRRRAQAVRAAAAGFTLIEVLISIIILALGLLGIGVVFPVVIRQQRISTDEMAGIVQAQNVASQLLTNVPTYPTSIPMGDRSTWYWWRFHLATAGLSQAEYERGLWTLPELDEDSGAVELAPSGSSTQLFPADRRVHYSAVIPAVPPHQPKPEEKYTRVYGQYVWDMAVQPVDDGDGDFTDDRLRLAVFIRRIDARTFEDGLPVAVDSDGLPAVHRRANQGGLAYAAPVTMQIEIVEDENDGSRIDRRRVELVGQNDTQWAIFSQPGQKFVDALGSVYTVQRVEDEEERRVRISPPIPATIRDDMAGLQLSIVTTPQPPVAVHIVEVTP